MTEAGGFINKLKMGVEEKISRTGEAVSAWLKPKKRILQPPERVRERANSIPTERNLADYAQDFGMSSEGLIAWIATKQRVLDIGAGSGLIKKQIDGLKEKKQFKGSAEIFSLDLRYLDSTEVKGTDRANYLAYPEGSRIATAEESREIGRKFRQTAVAATWSNIPFRDHSFDGILADAAFALSSTSKEQLLQAYHEVHRVLAKGATGLISLPETATPDNMFTMISPNQPINYTLAEISFLNPVFRQSPTTDRDGITTYHKWLEVTG